MQRKNCGRRRHTQFREKGYTPLPPSVFTRKAPYIYIKLSIGFEEKD
jgi:hypothetical protein